MTSTRVVVTGLGTTSPLGGDVPSTWQAMLAGTSGVRRLEDPWTEDLPVKIAARVAVEPSEVLDRVTKLRDQEAASQAAVRARRAAAGQAGPYSTPR